MLLRVLVICVFLSPLLSAQGSNQIPSNSSLRTESASSNRNVADRYEALSCSLVRITSDQGSGTGFFIGNDGTVATAAHVVLQTQFSLEGRIVRVTMTPKPNLKLTTTDGTVRQITPAVTKDDEVRAAADVAIVKTNLTPRCHLELGDSKSLRIGAHLVAFGYPAADSPVAALYDGFLSSRHPRAPIPIGSGGLQTVTTTHELLRVQMPLTAGTSGSPVVSDDDRVIGIVLEEPVLWAKEIMNFLALSRSPGFSVGMTIKYANGAVLNPVLLLGQFAAIVHDFESAGSGSAVPTYYLKVPTDAGRPDSKNIR